MIDDAHPCAGMKFLRNKPVKDLSGADFLSLVQAEGEGLLEMKISIDIDQGSQESRRGGTLQSYFEEIRQLFYRVCTVHRSLQYYAWYNMHTTLYMHAVLSGLMIDCMLMIVMLL